MSKNQIIMSNLFLFIIREMEIQIIIIVNDITIIKEKKR
jgi:hypothetical protein